MVYCKMLFEFKVVAMIAFASTLFCANLSNALSEDWARFRGPNGSGVYEGTTTPEKWDQENIEWKSPLKGAGVSSPIVVGDKVFLTSWSGYGVDGNRKMDSLKRHVICISKKDGKEQWSKTIDPVLPEEPFSGMGIPAHGYASHTPASDGKHLFVFFGRTGVLAFDLDGNKKWQVNVGKGESPRQWGSASSLLLYKDSVIVPAFCEDSALIALDKETGKEVWKQKADGFYSSWGTPILVKVDDKRSDLVVGVPWEIWGLNPANGKLRWYCPKVESRSFYTSVTSVGDRIFAAEGRGGNSVSVRAGGKGDVSETHFQWEGSDPSSFAAPVANQKHLFVISGGVAKCIDAKTGKRLNQVRLEGGSSRGGSGRSRGGRGGFGGGGFGGTDYASPILAGGKLYIVRANGSVNVLKADESLKVLGNNKMTEEKENFSATPAVSEGHLFIRSNKHLYCVGAAPSENSSNEKDK